MGVAGSCVGYPVRRLPIVVVKRAFAARVVGRELALARKVGRVAKLALGDLRPVAAELGVVTQGSPGNSMALLAEPEETADRHHSVDDAPARFLDDQALDRADVAVVGPVHR